MKIFKKNPFQQLSKGLLIALACQALRPSLHIGAAYEEDYAESDLIETSWISPQSDQGAVYDYSQLPASHYRSEPIGYNDPNPSTSPYSPQTDQEVVYDYSQHRDSDYRSEPIEYNDPAQSSTPYSPQTDQGAVFDYSQHPAIDYRSEPLETNVSPQSDQGAVFDYSQHPAYDFRPEVSEYRELPQHASPNAAQTDQGAVFDYSQHPAYDSRPEVSEYRELPQHASPNAAQTDQGAVFDYSQQPASDYRLEHIEYQKQEQATKEAAERTAKEQAAKDAAEQAAKERAAKEVAERIAKEQAAKDAAEQAAKEQAAKQAAEQAAKERAAKEVAERIAKEQAAKEAADRAAKEQAAKEAAERAAKEVAERIAKEQAAKEAAERAAKEAADRAAKEQAAKEAAERAAKEVAERAAKEQAAKEAAERAAKEQAAKEAAERAAQEQAEKERAAKEAADRVAKEQAAKEAAEQAAQEQAAKERAAKEAAEQAAKEQAAKEAAERAAKEQAEKEAAEQADKEAAEQAALQKTLQTYNSKEIDPSDLSSGTSNVKFIKKSGDKTPEKQSTADKYKSSHIIGKQIVAEPVVGYTNDTLDLSETNATSQSIQHKQAVPSTANDLIDLIAQTAPAAPVNPASTPRKGPTVITPDSEDPNQTSQSSEINVENADGQFAQTFIGDQTTQAQNPHTVKEISINFNNVAIIEYIRFISRISNKNFIFDDEDLQFNVTIVSEEPTSVENLMAALLQELRVRDLSLIEQGNNIMIHRNPRVRSPARIVEDGTELITSRESELVTRVFRLNTLDPVKASEIIRPLLSEEALVEVLRDTNNIIITDLVTNINKITQLIGTLDAPNSGVTIGQYVVRNAFVDSLVDLATKIMQPIAQGNPFTLVPHAASNSIFIVSNNFIVEKALAMLQNLDLNEGRTKILSLEKLQPTNVPGYGGPGRPGGIGGPGEGAAGAGRAGGVSTQGALVPGGGPGGPGGRYPPGTGFEGQAYPLGGISTEGQLYPGDPGAPGYPYGGPGFPGGPQGGLAPGGISTAGQPGFEEGGVLPFAQGGIVSAGRASIFDEGRDFMPGGISSTSRWVRELPTGHIERTLFFIYKLRYRKGDQIEIALRKMGASLQMTGTANVELIAAINSSQWLESSNSLIFTGTALALEKLKELILEIDVPMRQVFIEMLILETDITDSLTYGVDWVSRFGRLDGKGGTSGEQSFLGLGSTIAAAAESISGTPSILPKATGLLFPEGYTAAVIGTHLTHNGTHFNTIGALVKAIHTDGKTNILLNPKIITEDNNTAEIFVGGTDRYKTQSITNDLGSLVTNNFQFIDVGTTLRVTPLIGNNGIITLEIIQETTSGDPGANDNDPTSQSVNLVPVLKKTRTVTKIHVPDGFFVILSGMISDKESRFINQIPCLGGIPILGGMCKQKSNTDNKTNLMLFIRPLIIDTAEDFEDITKRQQDVFCEKSKFRRAWNYELDEALDFFSIRPTDPDDIGCGGCNQ